MKPPSIAILDKWFSIFIRKRDIPGEYGKCPTCQRMLPFSAFDCSHYISRQFYATRWNPKNCVAQCSYENRFQEGNKGLLRLHMVEIYGEEEISRLEAGKRQGRKPKPYEAVEILKRIKADIAGLGKTA